MADILWDRIIVQSNLENHVLWTRDGEQTKVIDVGVKWKSLHWLYNLSFGMVGSINWNLTNQMRLLLAILAGWITNRKQQAIDYLMVENRLLKEKLGKKRILLDDQCRRLAVKDKILDRNTILRWYRKLIAAKCDGSKHRNYGRPVITPDVQGTPT